MKSMRFSPINSIIFISDAMQGPAPIHTDDRLVHYNSFCVSVGCYPEADGETEFFVGRAGQYGQEPPNLTCAFDGILRTPSRNLTVWTVADELLLEDQVDESSTRVRVWIDHPKWPARMMILWGP